MKHILSTLCALILITLQARADDPNFEAKTYVYHDYSLPYREAIIYENSDSIPALVVLLHARHGRGTGNDAHKKADGVNDIVKYLKTTGTNSILIIPQAPENREWNEESPQKGFYMSDAVKSLIDSYIADNKVDANRVYILGASMGGSGVWRLINDYPDFFAGAMAVSAKARDVKIKNVVSTSILSVIGSRDRMVKAGSMEGAIKKINKNGGTAKFVLLEGYTHGDACRRGFTQDNLKWVFSHVKTTTPSDFEN